MCVCLYYVVLYYVVHMNQKHSHTAFVVFSIAASVALKKEVEKKKLARARGLTIYPY